MKSKEIKIAIVNALNSSERNPKYVTSKQIADDQNLDHEIVVAAMKVLSNKDILATNMHTYFKEGVHVHLAETGNLFYEFFDNPGMFDEKPKVQNQHIGDTIITNQGNESQSIVKSPYKTNNIPKSSWLKNNIIPILILLTGITSVVLAIYYNNQ